MLMLINDDYLVNIFYFDVQIKIILFKGIFSRFSNSNRQTTKQQKIGEIHESYRSHRPYFTYWVTFVQILVCIVSLIVYGYAPFSSTQPVIIFICF